MPRGVALIGGAWRHWESSRRLCGTEVSWRPLGVSWDVPWRPLGSLLGRLGGLLAALGGLLGRLECQLGVS
eukprot:3770132-Pyramimonas_sp.AAC.1